MANGDPTRHSSTRPWRLCMVVHGPYPIGEGRVTREAAAARQRGWEVDVVAMNSGAEPKRETVDGANVHRLAPLRGSRSGMGAIGREYVGFTLLALLRVGWLHAKRRYRVVQVHNPPDFLVAAAAIPRLFGARLIFDIHDFAPELFVLRHPKAEGTWLMRALDMIEQAATRFADAVVTVNEPYRRALLAKGVSEDRLLVVMNSLDESLLPDDWAPRDSRFVIMHHGTINEHYGVDVLVRAFSTFHDVQQDAVLEIYGTGDAASAVRALIADLGLAGSVHFQDSLLPQRIVLSEVPRASVGVVANLAIARNRSVLPVKLLEYVALGVPVVSSDLAGIREYFGDDEILYYRAGDPAALAAALESVASDPDGASRRAAAARARYQEHRWEVYADRYGELLARLATSDRRKRRVG